MSSNPSGDRAIPTLPARNLPEIRAFYEQLGFQNCSDSDYQDTYLILCRGTLEIHFFPMDDLDPTQSYSGCYCRVTDVATLFEEFRQQSLPLEGIPRLDPLEEKTWRMKEFYLVDPAGNLVRIGQAMERIE